MKHVLLVNPGPIKKKYILEHIKELGYKVTVVITEQFWAERVADDVVYFDGGQEKLIEDLKAYHSAHTLDGVLTFWDGAVVLTALIAESLNLPGPGHDLALLTKEKYLFREFCDRHDFVTPSFFRVSFEEQRIPELDQKEYPVILKPSLGAGSFGVFVAHSQHELEEHISSIFTNPVIKRIKSDILIETFFEGDEFDIDVVMESGKFKYSNITFNHPTPDDSFIETGNISPAQISQEQSAKILEHTETLFSALGLDNACIHYEFKMNDDGVIFPLEVNLRMGGDDTYYINSIVGGTDLIDVCLKISTLQPVTIGQKTDWVFASKYLLPDKSGKLTSLSLSHELTQADYFVTLDWYKLIGDHIEIPPVDFELLGWIGVKARTLAEAEQLLADTEGKYSWEIT